MALMRYDPWGGINQLQQEINRLFSTMSDSDTSSATAAWMPAVDIREYGDRFELFVDIPGVDPKDVEITLENGVLFLSGERVESAAKEGEQVAQVRLERGQGRFHRRFILPDTVDAEKVKASDRHGVLEISIPKQQKAQPRRIKVAA